MSGRPFSPSILEGFVNRLLSFDPETKERLAQFEGQLFKVHVEGLNIDLNMHLDADGVKFVKVSDGEDVGPPDVTLSGTPVAFMKLVTTRGGGSVLPEGVSVSGDIGVVYELKKVLDGMRLDWEEQLSTVTGDIFAHEVSRNVRTVWRWGKNTHESMLQNFAEYLKHESDLIPTRAELERFSTAVDQIRDDVERLEKRISRILAGC